MYRGNDRDDIVELVSGVLDYRNFNELNFKSRVSGYLLTKKKKRMKISKRVPACNSIPRSSREKRSWGGEIIKISVSRPN